MNEGASLRNSKKYQERNQKNEEKERETERGSQKQRVILAAYLLAALDMSCLFMQFSTVPYLAKNLGLDSVGFGSLQTTFGVLQLIGGPVFGRFSDQFGVRAALTLSFLCGSLFYLLLGISTNIPLLFVSRIPSLFMHGLPGAQMVVTKWTTPTERAGALGKFGLCMGLGMIIGSSLGGVLATKFGLQFPTFVALTINLLCIPAVLVYIPPRTEPDEPGTQTTPSKSSSVFNIREITRLMRLPGVTPIFTVKLLSGLPFGLFMIMFAVISINFFGLNPQESGYLMSYFGVIQMFMQAVVIGRLTKRYSDDTLLLVSVAVSSVVGVAMALMGNVFHFCVIAIPLVFALAILAVITDSILTKSVPSSDTGAMLGICASIHPLTRTVAPTIGGVLFKSFGVSSFGCLHFTVNFILVFYLLRRKFHSKGQKLE
ncbi:solute carrier family 67 member A1 isoform X2 [Lissotriton helveticus]